MKYSSLFSLLALSLVILGPASGQQPIVGDDVVFAETQGLVSVEAEHFFRQTKTDIRQFYLVTADTEPEISPDGDPAHVAGASGGAYLEILPDTRRTHADKLTRGENFSPDAGKMAVLSYKVHISSLGRYYVWVRAFSTGSEDNGLHVGLDGEWPESGQRLQWCEGKRTWRWESKQRTEKQHCGEPHKIFLDIEQPGTHTIAFSMREDGFEFDKWLMTQDREFARPTGVGPGPELHAGATPKPFPAVAAMQTPPPTQAKTGDRKRLRLAAGSFTLSGTGFYLDRGKWAAINPEQRKQASAGMTIPYPTGKYHVTLEAVGESDGKSTYSLSIDDQEIGDFECPLSDEMFAEGKKFHRTWKAITITEGAVVRVQAAIGSEDGAEFSRARWAAVAFEPADEATQRVARRFIAEHATVAQAGAKDSSRRGSPTKAVSDLPLILPRQADGDGGVELAGELKVWHNVTLTLDGPYAHEKDNAPNPFTDHRMTVQFKHSDGTTYTVPGYFAADGKAANSSAESGRKWRVHFAPDRAGDWTYEVRFATGKQAALDADAAAKALDPFDGKSGQFSISASDKVGRDLRAQGRLQYVGKRYLQHAGSKRYFLKAGADAPETLLGYADFDNTVAGKAAKVPLKTWAPHLQDWRAGDPTWKDGKGRGLIGAINYLAGKGCNAFSFLTYNASGDGDNVWPFIQREDKLHYDCSKLDQWGIVFEHGTRKGMYLHFKMQETEMDDHNRGHEGKKGFVAACLDGGDLGIQRKLYCRELIARFGHNLALNWNLGEENTQSTEQQQAMINYIADTDPYGHNIVIHTFPSQQDKVYRPLLGSKSKLTGASLQNSDIKDTHEHTVKWVRASTEAGKPWIVAFDESGTAAHGQCPDLGYKGFDGRDRTGKKVYDEHAVRRQTLWGTLMGGGAGVEYYFGYQFVENDLVCEDWRSRDRSWDYCRIALDFFRDQEIPIEQTEPADELVGNPKHDNSKYCLAKPGELYLIYLPNGGRTELDLRDATGQFSQSWLNPRTGEVTAANVQIEGGSKVEVSSPPDNGEEDWLIVLKRQ